MSQFSLLKAEFSPVFAHAHKAETIALSDPRGACFYARLVLVTAVDGCGGAAKGYATLSAEC